jgi:hypothetical protein
MATVLAQAPHVTVHVKSGVNGWQIAAALGTCVAAFAALLTARSSLGAARASAATARDAREALGLASRPHLGTQYIADSLDARTLVASVRNFNQYAAADLSIEVHLRDGDLRLEKTDRLGEAPGPMSKAGPYWLVRFEGVLTEELHTPLGKSVDFALVRWWDSQRIVQWEERTTFPPEGGQLAEDRRIT